MRQRLRKQQFESRELGEHARDVQAALDQIPQTEVKSLATVYKDGLVLACQQSPVAIELIRCTTVISPETPVAHGTAVSFTWRPQSGGAQITRIDGLSSGTTQYNLTFRITY
jgi:hypothetical protein